MIHFDDVTKRYIGTGEALRECSFRVAPGEMVFLTGRSGAGKSTLLRIVALLEYCTHGQVRVGGYNLARISRRQIPYYRRKIGMIFQDHRLLFDRTVFDNVAMPLVVTGLPHGDIARRVRAALDKVGLLEKERAYPVTLSTGEQQRVGIARAVVGRPPVVLADEPTGNLDPELANEIMGIFEEFNRVGTTLLIASHDLGLIKKFGRRIMVLDKGKLISDIARGEGKG